MAHKALAPVLVGALLTTTFASTLDVPTQCLSHPALYPELCCKGRAPEVYNVTHTVVNVTKGAGAAAPAQTFTVMVRRSWAPIGADRFWNLARCGFYSGNYDGAGNYGGIFRVVTGFVAQWGIAGEPAISTAWNALDPLPNDPVLLSNVRGTVAYAAEQDPVTGQACNRTTQVYVNAANNSRLDGMGFAPFGIVSEADMAATVDHFTSKWAQQPDQDAITAEGDAYLEKNFPGLTYISTVTIAPAPPAPGVFSTHYD